GHRAVFRTGGDPPRRGPDRALPRSHGFPPTTATPPQARVRPCACVAPSADCNSVVITRIAISSISHLKGLWEDLRHHFRRIISVFPQDYQNASAKFE
ncbi:MAG: hypothetical protein WCW68_07590, partial [Methanothrix sp.]